MKNLEKLVAYRASYLASKVPNDVTEVWWRDSLSMGSFLLPGHSPSKTVGEWLIVNFLSGKVRRPKVELNLWLWSAGPNVGKASLVAALKRLVIIAFVIGII